MLQNMFGGNNARSSSALMQQSTVGGGGGGASQQRLLNIQNSAAAGTRAAGSVQYNNNGTAGNAQISVDPVTHNLIVIADKETKDQITRTLSQLDAPAATTPGDAIVLNATNATATFTVSGGEFYSGVTKDDVSGLRNLLTTNAIASNQRRQLNILDNDPQSIGPSPTLTQQQLQNYQVQQIAGEKEYMQVQTQLNELQSLQATNPAELGTSCS